MNVYSVMFDAVAVIVVAESFGLAVDLWREYSIEKWKADGDYEEGDENREPDEVILLHEVEAVVRQQDVGKKES